MLSDGRGGTEMETVKGDIQACLAHLDSASRFTTGAGSIHLDLAAINGSVDIRTDAGAVELWLPDGFAGELNAATDQGDIDCKLPITPTLQTNTLLRGRLGTGEGPLVRAQARYGSIHIRSRTS